MQLEITYLTVGITRSGKIIPYTSSASNINVIARYFKECHFSADDLLDAFAVFNYLALRGIRRGDDTVIFDRHANIIEDFFDPKELHKAKNRASINSAFDLRDLGKILASIEFTDF